MRHLEERGGLRGLSVPTISAPTADGRQHRRVPASRNPVRSTSSLLFTLHVPMCPPLHAPTCARNPPAPSGRFVLTILSYSQPTGFNHPLTPLNLSHRGVPPPPVKGRVCSRFPRFGVSAAAAFLDIPALFRPAIRSRTTKFRPAPSGSGHDLSLGFQFCARCLGDLGKNVAFFLPGFPRLK